MTAQEKCHQLRQLIIDTLTPLITHDYVLWDLPYHANIGDQLIWEGEEQFLRTIPFRCLERRSVHTYRKTRLHPSTVILLHGGGNFGDVWEHYQLFRKQILRDYPHNPVIILPQTVYYESSEKISEDAPLFRSHPNVYICARDRRSHEFLVSNNFAAASRILLLPDMAFCIDTARLRQHRKTVRHATLFVNRIDKENSGKDYSRIVPSCAEVHDWPPFEHPDLIVKRLEWARWKFGQQSPVIDFYARHIYHPHLIRQGVQFVSRYSDIYSTRLHVCILSVLLGKPLHLIDNTYGKNSTFHDTWLSDAEGLSIL